MTFLTPPLNFDQSDHTQPSLRHHGSISIAWLGYDAANSGEMSRRRRLGSGKNFIFIFLNSTLGDEAVCPVLGSCPAKIREMGFYLLSLTYWASESVTYSFTRDSFWICLVNLRQIQIDRTWKDESSRSWILAHSFHSESSIDPINCKSKQTVTPSNLLRLHQISVRFTPDIHRHLTLLRCDAHLGTWGGTLLLKLVVDDHLRRWCCCREGRLSPLTLICLSFYGRLFAGAACIAGAVTW